MTTSPLSAHARPLVFCLPPSPSLPLTVVAPRSFFTGVIVKGWCDASCNYAECNYDDADCKCEKTADCNTGQSCSTNKLCVVDSKWEACATTRCDHNDDCNVRESSCDNGTCVPPPPPPSFFGPAAPDALTPYFSWHAATVLVTLFVGGPLFPFPPLLARNALPTRLFMCSTAQPIAASDESI